MEHQVNFEAESLILDAKKAILEDQHSRFQDLQAAGMWPEAMQQLQVTLACAADLLKDSVALLERAVNKRKSQNPTPGQNLLPPTNDEKAES